jgi:hypothetical protein
MLLLRLPLLLLLLLFQGLQNWAVFNDLGCLSGKLCRLVHQL